MIENYSSTNNIDVIVSRTKGFFPYEFKSRILNKRNVSKLILLKI